MVDGYKISVLFNTYHPERYSTLQTIVDKWLDQPIDQLWVVDGGQGADFDCRGRAEHIMVPQSIHTRGDYALAYATDGDLLIFTDDDLFPLSGFTQDLVDGYKLVGPDVFVGIFGREWHDKPVYKKGTTPWKGKHFERDGMFHKKVDMLGITFMCPRFVLKNFDTRGMPRMGDDLWLNVCWPEVDKYVVRTDRFENLPTSVASHAHSTGSEDSRKERYELFEKVFYEKKARESQACLKRQK